MFGAISSVYFIKDKLICQSVLALESSNVYSFSLLWPYNKSKRTWHREIRKYIPSVLI
jgi:hypothetical protein